MLLGTRPKLQGLLIRRLLDVGACTAVELREYLQEAGHRFTKQAVYFDLAALIAQSVVLKRGDLYDIRMSWMFELQGLINKRFGATSKTRNKENNFCEIYRVRTMVELHQMWSSIALEAQLRSSGDIYYEWVPHFWFPFADARSEEQVVKEHAELKMQYNSIVGHDTFLDREAVKTYHDLPGQILFAEAPAEKLKDHCLSVVGAYVITIQIPPEFWAKMHEIIQPITSWTDPEVEKLRLLMRERTKIELRFEKNAPKAKQMRDLLKPWFSESKNKAA